MTHHGFRLPLAPSSGVSPVARLARRLAAVVAAVVLGGASAAAQVQVLDEGSFTILRGTARAGREDFSIRTTADAGGGVIGAQATVAIGDRRLLPALGAQASGAVTSYQLEVRDRSAVADRWILQVSGVRAVVRHRTAAEDASSEFPATGAPVLLDDDIAHQLWFVLRRAGDGPVAATVPVLRLREGTVRTATVSPATDDPRPIGGRTLPARRREVRLPDGTRWEAWADPQGRLLEVAMPGGLRFLRDDPPPTP